MTFRKKLRDELYNNFFGYAPTEKFKQAEQRIIELVREIVGEEATWDNPDPDIQHGSNDRREKILQRLEEK